MYHSHWLALVFVHLMKSTRCQRCEGQAIWTNTILMLLLLAGILVHVNRFSWYLQTHNLIFATLAWKFSKLIESLQNLAENDGPSFSEHAIQFLSISKERMVLAHRLHCCDLLKKDEVVQDFINHVPQQVKLLFMIALIEEL